VEQYAGKPFVLLGVNSDEDREALNKTLIEERITWRSWWDDGRIDGPIHTTWQIDLRPAIHLLDHKGVIRYRDIPPDKVDAAIAKLLEELTAEK
jgi:hypothetical protein